MVFISGVGVFLDFHTCQNELVSIGIYMQAGQCDQFDASENCDKDASESCMQKDQCCSNHNSFLKNETETDQSNAGFLKIQKLALISASLFQILPTSNQVVQATYSIPLPDIEKDINVWNQTFLI